MARLRRGPRLHRTAPGCRMGDPRGRRDGSASRSMSGSPRYLAATRSKARSVGAKARIFLDVLGRPFVNGIAHPDPNVCVSGSRGAAAFLGAPCSWSSSARDAFNAVPLVADRMGAPGRRADRSCPCSRRALVRVADGALLAGLLMLLAPRLFPCRLLASSPSPRPSLIVQFARGRTSPSISRRARPPRRRACASGGRPRRAVPNACSSGRAGAAPGRLGEPLETGPSLGLRPPPHVSPSGRCRRRRVDRRRTRRRARVLLPRRPDARDLYDFHRLDLVLAPGAAVTWRVDLPSDLQSARFRDASLRSPPDDAPAPARGARVRQRRFEAISRDARASSRPATGRKPLTMDLRPYAGRT